MDFTLCNKLYCNNIIILLQWFFATYCNYFGYQLQKFIDLLQWFLPPIATSSNNNYNSLDEIVTTFKLVFTYMVNYNTHIYIHVR